MPGSGQNPCSESNRFEISLADLTAAKQERNAQGWPLTVPFTYVLDNVTEKKKCSVKIFQTPSKIKVHTSFWNEDEDKNKIEETKTYSESTVEEFFENHSDIFELHFYYSNGGNLNSTIPVRRGYNVLKYNKKTKKFGGFYFSQNSKSQGSGGKMSITFKRKI